MPEIPTVPDLPWEEAGGSGPGDPLDSMVFVGKFSSLMCLFISNSNNQFFDQRTV